MSYNSIIDKYYEVHNDMLKNEFENGLKKGPIKVLPDELKILNESYKEFFGFEPDGDTLLFGRKVIEMKF